MGLWYPKLFDLGEVVKDRGCCRAAAGGAACCNRQLEQTHRCHCLGRVTALIMTGPASVRARIAAVGGGLVTAPGATKMLKPNKALRSYLEVEISSIVATVRCRCWFLCRYVYTGMLCGRFESSIVNQSGMDSLINSDYQVEKLTGEQIPSSRSILFQARYLGPTDTPKKPG